MSLSLGEIDKRIFKENNVNFVNFILSRPLLITQVVEQLTARIIPKKE
jgi:hypothetical protein